MSLFRGTLFYCCHGAYSALMGKEHSIINKINHLGKFALYKHYKLASSPDAEKLFAQSNVQIFLSELAWIWGIPLVDGRLNVGLVMQKNQRLSGII